VSAVVRAQTAAHQGADMGLATPAPAPWLAIALGVHEDQEADREHGEDDPDHPMWSCEMACDWTGRSHSQHVDAERDPSSAALGRDPDPILLGAKPGVTHGG